VKRAGIALLVTVAFAAWSRTKAATIKTTARVRSARWSSSATSTAPAWPGAPDRWEIMTAVVSSSTHCAAVLQAAGIAPLFDVRVDGLALTRLALRGKPAPDVYLEAARRLGVAAENCAAVEDSRNGIRSAHAAGMRVIAIPNAHYPPSDDALAVADVVLASLDELTVGRVSAS